MFALLLLSLLPLCALNVWMHELGHAAAGRLLGYHLYEVRLGSGHLLKRFYFLDCDWWIYATPFGGWCVSSPVSPKFYRLKQAIYILAGPAMDVLLIILVWFLAAPVLTFLGCRPEEAEEGLILYLLTLGWLTLWSWKPQATRLYGKEVRTDSWHLLQLLKTAPPRPSPSEFHVLSKVGVRCWSLWQEGRKAEAARYFLKARKRGILPSHPEFMMEMAFLCKEAGLWRRARRLCVDAANRSDTKSTLHMNAVDLQVCIALDFNRREFFPEEKKLIEAEISRHPDEITLKGTLGAILAELHQTEAALKLLEEVLLKSPAIHDQAISAAYLAWIHAGKGDFESARLYLKKAAALKVSHAQVRRKTDETNALLEKIPQLKDEGNL